MNLNQLKLSFRNVTRQSKRSTMLGLAMGFGVMIAVMLSALTSGMSASAIENFSKAMGGHVYVSGEIVAESGRSQSLIIDTQVLNDAVNHVSEYVEHVSFRSSVRGNLSFGSKTISGNVQGIDFAAETQATDAMKLVDGSFTSVLTHPSLIISQSDAAELEIGAGDSVFVKASTVSGQQNLVEWMVGAVIEDTEGFDVTTFYAPLNAVNALIDIEATQFQNMNLEVTDLGMMDIVRDELTNYLTEHASIKVDDDDATGPLAMMELMMGGTSEIIADPWTGTQFEVTSLNDRMSDIMSLVDVLQLSSDAVFVVILLIIMVGISNSYRMVILERIQEIGTMRAMGAQRNWVFSLFVSESVMIAVLGSIAGLLASLGLMALLGSIELSGIGGPIQLFTIANYLQFPTTLGTFVGPIAITLVIAALAVYFPAKRASSMAPSDALRATA